MNLSPEQAFFLLKAIETAYDTACVFKLFGDEFGVETMEDAMEQLRVRSKEAP